MIGGGRLRAFLAMDDPTDYYEFVAICEEFDLEPLSLRLYTDALGKLLVAMNMYPTIDVTEAYIKLITKINMEAEKQFTDTKARRAREKPCKGCSQKKTRNGGGVR